MIREVRTLASYGLQTDSKTNTIIFPLSPTKRLLIELQTLPSDAFRPVLGPQPDSYLATGINLALHHLLSLSHRRQYRNRTSPPPPISGQPRPNNPFPILRSLLTRHSHETVVSSLHSLLTPLCTALSSAHLPSPPTYTIIPGTSSPFPSHSTPERILIALTNQLESLTTIIFPLPLSSPPQSSIPSSFSHTTPIATTPSILQIRTVIATQNNSRPIHYLRLTPETSPLLEICPPHPMVSEWYHVKEYILWTIGCWLAHIFTSPSKEKGGWKTTAQANILRKNFSGSGGVKQILFEASSIPVLGPEKPDQVGEKGAERIKVEIKWEWTTSVDMEWEGKERRDLKEGEGAYDWFSGGTGCVNGNGELEEIVRGMAEVVEEAGREINRNGKMVE